MSATASLLATPLLSCRWSSCCVDTSAARTWLGVGGVVAQERWPSELFCMYNCIGCIHRAQRRLLKYPSREPASLLQQPDSALLLAGQPHGLETMPKLHISRLYTTRDGVTRKGTSRNGVDVWACHAGEMSKRVKANGQLDDQPAPQPPAGTQLAASWPCSTLGMVACLAGASRGCLVCR